MSLYCGKDFFISGQMLKDKEVITLKTIETLADKINKRKKEFEEKEKSEENQRILFFKQNNDKLKETAVKYLKKTGLYEEVKGDLNMQASKLSGGQQQRLVIARCLTVNPEVILLDEPCSALDIKNTANIESMLLELKKDYTIIIVTHNLAQAKRIADYVIYMEDGTIAEIGKTDEIFDSPIDLRTKEYIMYMKN